MRVEVHACDTGGCGHYRAIWPGWAVDGSGAHEVRVRVPGSDDPPSLPVLWAGDRPVGLREREEGWPDVMVFQRPLRWQMLVAIRLLQEQGVAVVVELDDDFEAVTPRNVAWSPELHEKVQALFACCDQADLVTVSTPALAEKYAPHGRVVVLPNYLPGHHLLAGQARLAALREPSTGPVVLGWAGGVNVHRDDLPVVGNGLARARRAAALETEFHVVGTGVDVARGLGIARVDSASGWVELKDYPTAMSHLDLGLAPLEPTAFNRSKSWLKPLEYAGAGVPCVVSETDEYRRLIEAHPGSVVATCQSPDDWRRTLTALLSDRAQLRHYAALALDAVKDATIENHREDWAAAWTAARAYHQQGH